MLSLYTFLAPNFGPPNELSGGGGGIDERGGGGGTDDISGGGGGIDVMGGGGGMKPFNTGDGGLSVVGLFSVVGQALSGKYCTVRGILSSKMPSMYSVSLGLRWDSVSVPESMLASDEVVSDDEPSTARQSNTDGLSIVIFYAIYFITATTTAEDTCFSVSANGNKKF